MGANQGGNKWMLSWRDFRKASSYPYKHIDSLLLYAGIHLKIFGYHRLLSKRFPYAVYYTVEQELVVIRRVLDLRRRPPRIRQALK